MPLKQQTVVYFHFDRAIPGEVFFSSFGELLFTAVSVFPDSYLLRTDESCETVQNTFYVYFHNTPEYAGCRVCVSCLKGDTAPLLLDRRKEAP